MAELSGVSNISKTIFPIDFKLGTHILNGIIYNVANHFFYAITHSYIINVLRSSCQVENE